MSQPAPARILSSRSTVCGGQRHHGRSLLHADFQASKVRPLQALKWSSCLDRG